MLKLSVKEANDLAEQIESGGGNADSLRSAINEVNDAKNGHSSVPANKMNDEDHVQRLRSQSPIEKGKDLECLVCHEKVDQLIAGTCEVWFREWALATTRQPKMRKLI